MRPISKGKKIDREIPFLLVRDLPLIFCIFILSGMVPAISDAGDTGVAITGDEAIVFADSPVGPHYSGTESLLTTSASGSDQALPAIWGDRVTWVSNYPDPAGSGSSLTELYLCNLTTGETTKLASGLTQVTMLDIWSDLIVWDSREGEYSDIYLYDFSNDEIRRLTNDSVNQVKPQVWGDYIVWQEGDDSDPEWNVYLYDIIDGTTLKLGDGSGSAMSPAIWDDRIVWQDWRNGADYDIYLYNGTTGIETRITTDSSDQIAPSIWGDRIVWQDFRHSTSQVYMYDEKSGTETQVATGDKDLENPVISDNFLVYINQSDYFDIWITDLLTGEQGKISQDLTGSAQMDPDIWGDRIVWTDARNGDNDIFLYTLGISMPPLSADFIQNITQGGYP